MAQIYMMIKPGDSQDKRVVGIVKSSMQKVGLEIVKELEFTYTGDSLDKHYSNIAEKPFYPEVKEYMLEGPVLGMIVEGGKKAVETGRALTEVLRVEIPKHLGRKPDKGRNIIHCSDSLQNAEKEIAIFNGLTKDKNGDYDRN